MLNIDDRIAKWENKLLDLSRRNPLIHFKAFRRSSLKIISPALDQIYASLVHKNHTLEFVYREPESTLWTKASASPPSEALPEIPLKARQLLSDQDDYSLFLSLSQLKKRAKLSLDEQGINILFLSFAFLQWKESLHSETLNLSPLLMVPVSLEQKGLRDLFQLSLYEDEIVLNPTLSYKLETDFKIKLPTISEEDFELPDLFQQIEALALPADWKIIPETYLSLFSYNKMKIYQDLSLHREQISKHYFVQGLGGNKAHIPSIPHELQEIDHDKVKPCDTFQIMDADSSQLDAITAVSKGYSIVLHGPPGTGKSQTIANIIADCLARNKKVLFVSEKTAALKVVYHRLEQAGVSDFCLPLHSSKSNKREVLDMLRQSLENKNITLKSQVFQRLDELESYRQQLNDYVRSLHQECAPLHRSIYEVYGEALKYRDAPDLAFSSIPIASVSSQDLHQYGEVLGEFARTAQKMGNSYQDNCWYGCTVNDFKLETRHNLETLFKHYIGLSEAWLKSFDELKSRLQLPLEASYENLPYLIQLCTVASRSPKAPVHFLIDSDLATHQKIAREDKESHEHCLTLAHELSEFFTPHLFDLPVQSMLGSFEKLLGQIKQVLPYAKVEALLDIRSLAFDDYKKLIDQSSLYLSLGQNLSKILDYPLENTFQSYAKLYHLLKILLHRPEPGPLWYRYSKNQKLRELCKSAWQASDKILLSDALLKDFDREILEIDAFALLQRFRVHYSGLFKYFKSTYRQDLKLLRSYAKNPRQALKDTAWVKVLETLNEIKAGRAYLEKNHENCSEILGQKYQGLNTRWEELWSSILHFESLNEIFPEGIPEHLQAFLQHPDRMLVLLQETAPSFLGLHESQLSEQWQSYLPQSADIPALLKQAQSLVPAIEELREISQKLYSCMKSTDLLSLPSIRKILSQLNEWHEMNQLLQSKEKMFTERYQQHYQGLNTSWEHIFSLLNWCEELSTLLGKDSSSYQYFIKAICQDDQHIQACHDFAQSSQSWIKQQAEDYTALQNCFAKGLRSFSSISIRELLNWLRECLEHFSLLEEWIDYRKAHQRCLELGLQELIDQAMAKLIPPASIPGAFFKRFYFLWLDHMQAKFPAIEQFRSTKHQQAIEAFQTADTELFALSRLRLRQVCLDQRPSMNSFTENTGEMGLLNKEINKKSRIKPLRILFRQIPNLLLALKPCLMMSPLSVSLLLDPQSYHFDTVIFDEASQICTEDAIGAIYRGKQLVIAGDSEQLPPSNFFNVSSVEEEFSYEEGEEDDSDAFESILDEARTILPERKLLWHYRSKHEHLIAFSNAMIYENRLITFPSLLERGKDQGVEYIYLPEGCYDRSGKRNNLIEAEKIASLVVEHFQSRSELSLGVIAFSTAQQQAIEEALRTYRLNHPEMEPFFDENREEAFFVKNLETVQGDERDVILLSIGYARDSKGSLSMNFGPLNREGGYRRLNVAITRARFNLKLVGSILAHDIDLSRTESKGAQLLRHYIEYAQLGPQVLPERIKAELATESLFEEEVYHFLCEKGYTVDTQVGCSGFRIDMAIRDPEQGGKYVLGIECDGASYHSTRMARERDRLRQALLEDRGWKIYRIWSTDWIKDFPSESRRLLEAIQEALKHKGKTFDAPLTPKDLGDQGSRPELLYQEKIEAKEDRGDFYQFSAYTEFDCSFMYQHPDYPSCHKLNCKQSSCIEWDHATQRLLSQPCKRVPSLVRIIPLILKHQGPTHLEILGKKLTFLFERSKVSPTILEKISDCIAHSTLKNSVYCSGDFCYLRGQDLKVRIPKDKDQVRHIQHICPEELRLAIKTIRSHHLGIQENELIDETARVFGFQRSGPKIQAILSKLI
jgi:very-short-patch-repair endonuclease/DNA polymerase III delta prime subunit